MNKQITITLLLAFCMAVSCANNSTNITNTGQCKGHQAWAKAKPFIQSIGQGHSPQALKAVNNFVTAFENQNPAVANATQLGVCNQFAGQQSCCNAQLVKFIETAALYKVKPLQNQNNIVQKYLNTLVKQIGKSTCNAKSGVSKPSSANDIINNKNFTTLSSFLNRTSTCKIQFATAMTQFTRGAACSVCAGVDKLSTYFDNKGNLLVSQSSANAFTSAANSAIQCFSNLITFADSNGYPGLNTITNNITSYYVDSACQSAILTKVQNLFANNGGVNSTNACSATKVFSVQSSCEGAQQGNSTLDNLAGSRFLSELDLDGLRLLQSADDATVTTNGGISVVVPSTSDSSIDANGNVSTTTPYDNSSVINTFLLGAFAVFIAVLY